MKALIIQHEEDTPPGSSLDWLCSRGISYEIIFANEGLTKINQEEFDILFICGGAMNVDQEDLYPWLKVEKEFITRFIKDRKKIIGLCLGAQLLAEILGGEVRPHPFWEVGWQTVDLGNHQTLCVFQWHAYSFTLPPKAKLIATNKACTQQGFSYQDQILAYQFHPEADKKWIEECANDPQLPPKDKFVQSRSEILENIYLQEKLQAWYFRELDTFFIP